MNSKLSTIKTFEIQKNGQTSFLLSFEKVKEKIKITVIEKDSFIQNKYQNYYNLEDFIAINKWFNIFNNIETLLYKFEQLTKNQYLSIEQKNKKFLSLFIIFLINLIDKIEIILQVNEINQQTEIKDKAPKIQKNKNRYDSFHITSKLLKNYEEMRINGKRYYNNKRKIFKSNIIIIIYMIIINLIQINNSDNEYFVPNITIPIKGPGTKKILSDYFFKNNNNFPNKIFINGNENTTMNYSYYLNQTNNTVQLLWNNNNIDSSYKMFYYCSDITEIDFSNFVTSKVTDIAEMFLWLFLINFIKFI